MPYFNDFSLTHAWSDKNMYEKLIPGIFLPKTIIKNMNDMFYNCNNTYINKIEAAKEINGKTFIIKPSLDTGGGKSVEKISCFSLNDALALFDKYKKDFIIQEVVIQHSTLASFNPSSINTIRMLTYRDLTNKIHYLTAALRIGRNGEIVDNKCAGGIFRGLTKEGKLSKTAYSLPKCLIMEQSDVGTKFEGSILPYYKELSEYAISLHQQMPYFRIVAWDLSIEEAGKPIVIEWNLECPDSALLQIPNGPLLGTFTEEILTEVFKKKK